jgi:hypothetical protein
VIILRPAGEPRPALKYRLVPETKKLVPGNAAIFYHRAIQFWSQARTRLLDNEKADAKGRKVSIDEKVSQWIELPISEIPMEAARAVQVQCQSTLHEIELAAFRSTCDWEFDSRQEGYFLLIPEIQEMRALARLASLKCRIAIRDGKTDEAMRWIQIGMAMGRHVGKGALAIQALVGIAIDNKMTQCLEEAIQTPGTPSLFWALADRPRPMIDMRSALESERNGLEKALPDLRQIDGTPWSLERARAFANELETTLFSLGGSRPPDGKMAMLSRQIGVAAMAAKIYPAARRALIAEGRRAEEVDAMPVVQAAVLFTLREYERDQDDSYKWLNVPYWKSYNQIDKGLLNRRQGWEQKLANPLLSMFDTVSPALNSLRQAGLRLERQLDALQCVEAVRQYAAAHAGQLPASLEALTDTPVPFDVLTGKPFSYTMDGDHAVLTAPSPPGGPDHPSYRIHFVLKLAR